MYGDAGLLVQPRNRGTGPAIAYSLVRLQEIDPAAVIGFFPSDHYFADEDAFSDSVRQAFEVAELHAGSVVLLGMKAARPEKDYGWIEPGKCLSAKRPGLVFSVSRFWEKPSATFAAELMRRGCFRNSSIMVGSAESFMRLISQAAPQLLQPFQAIAPAFFTRIEEATVLDVYLSIARSSFSRDVLSGCPGNLTVLDGGALDWTDVSDVEQALLLMASAELPAGYTETGHMAVQQSAGDLSSGIRAIPACHTVIRMRQ
jgi:mannose-1-phosphate guanylyltransferase